jgi:hypothetical protein
VSTDVVSGKAPTGRCEPVHSGQNSVNARLHPGRNRGFAARDEAGINRRRGESGLGTAGLRADGSGDVDAEQRQPTTLQLERPGHRPGRLEVASEGTNGLLRI